MHEGSSLRWHDPDQVRRSKRGSLPLSPAHRTPVCSRRVYARRALYLWLVTAPHAAPERTARSARRARLCERHRRPARWSGSTAPMSRTRRPPRRFTLGTAPYTPAPASGPPDRRSAPLAVASWRAHAGGADRASGQRLRRRHAAVAAARHPARRGGLTVQAAAAPAAAPPWPAEGGAAISVAGMGAPLRIRGGADAHRQHHEGGHRAARSGGDAPRGRRSRAPSTASRTATRPRTGSTAATTSRRWRCPWAAC